MTYLLLMTFLHLIPMTSLAVILISISILTCLTNPRRHPYRLVTAWLVWRLKSSAGAAWRTNLGNRRANLR